MISILKSLLALGAIFIVMIVIAVFDKEQMKRMLEFMEDLDNR